MSQLKNRALVMVLTPTVQRTIPFLILQFTTAEPWCFGSIKKIKKDVLERAESEVRMNQIIVSGRLVDDVVERTSGKGTKFAAFKIAWNKRTKDGDKALFFDVTAFEQSAEFAKKNFKKGSPVEVVGELDAVTNEKDGVKYTNLRITATSVGFYGFPMKKGDKPEEAAE